MRFLLFLFFPPKDLKTEKQRSVILQTHSTVQGTFDFSSNFLVPGVTYILRYTGIY